MTREEKKAHSKKYYQEHKEEIKADVKKYRLEHKLECKVSGKKWRQNHKEEIRETKRKYGQEHKKRNYASLSHCVQKALAENKKYNRIRSRRFYIQFRSRTLEKLGNKCVKCGFSDPRALQIDHVYGGGRKEVTRLGTFFYHKKVLEDEKGNYQLLCANCNCIKRTENHENRHSEVH